ncbi:hypothetical protein JJB07_07705 [Tumebacillus sp. ITR2]|uniref:Spore coat protein n=1 Tax=Tumebacillus amylolyticus TaxID=2801339 RepID=A0ABS1J8F0_9BACL|nr:hypothetical protein [Tumebacillus amylolyticus]MBL0386531.1 hypothetical protein [Tumebacillus amylolyticus]
MNEKEKNVAKGLSDLLITDVFIKHGVEQKKRNLTPDQKAQIKSLVQDLQNQVEQYLQKTAQTPPVVTPGPNASATPTPEKKSESSRPRRRLTLKRNTESQGDESDSN